MSLWRKIVNAFKRGFRRGFKKNTNDSNPNEVITATCTSDLNNTYNFMTTSSTGEMVGSIPKPHMTPEELINHKLTRLDNDIGIIKLRINELIREMKNLNDKVESLRRKR